MDESWLEMKSQNMCTNLQILNFKVEESLGLVMGNVKFSMHSKEHKLMKIFLTSRTCESTSRNFCLKY